MTAPIHPGQDTHSQHNNPTHTRKCTHTACCRWATSLAPSSCSYTAAYNCMQIRTADCPADTQLTMIMTNESGHMIVAAAHNSSRENLSVLAERWS